MLLFTNPSFHEQFDTDLMGKPGLVATHGK